MSCLRKAEFNAAIETASLLSNGVWVVELKIGRKSLGLQKNDPFVEITEYDLTSDKNNIVLVNSICYILL